MMFLVGYNFHGDFHGDFMIFMMFFLWMWVLVEIFEGMSMVILMGMERCGKLRKQTRCRKTEDANKDRGQSKRKWWFHQLEIQPVQQADFGLFHFSKSSR